ncbi:3'-5' exonuclease [Candidatus Woesearchaeota archaeon]|nr:3'-5' exonuclease [Candidatus Woesearchaeota archaeon]
MIVVNVGTTGTNPEKHSIVSIGAVDFLDQTNQFYKECRIWEGAEITEKALEINGFSIKDITDPNKASLEHTINLFLEWTGYIADKTLGGYNPSFDMGFLKNSAERYGLKWSAGYRTVDLHSLSYSEHLILDVNMPIKDGKSDLSLDKTLNFVGLPNQPRPHNALTGAKLEAEAFSRIIYKKGWLFEEFMHYSLPHHPARGNKIF